MTRNCVVVCSFQMVKPLLNNPQEVEEITGVNAQGGDVMQEEEQLTF